MQSFFFGFSNSNRLVSCTATNTASNFVALGILSFFGGGRGGGGGEGRATRSYI